MEYCINGINHSDGTTKLSDNLIGGYCQECIEKMRWGQKKTNTIQDGIRKLINKINQDYEQTVMVATDDFWKRNRKYLLEIDARGGYKVLTDREGRQLYADQKEFFLCEFPHLNPESVARQRSIARIEQQLNIPIGRYPYRTLEPLRQFEIRDNKGQENPKQIEKLKETWSTACHIANSDRPNKAAIAEAVQKVAGKGRRELSNYQKAQKTKKQKERRDDLKEKCQKLECECKELQEENQFLKQQLEESRKEIQELKSRIELLPIAIAC